MSINDNGIEIPHFPTRLRAAREAAGLPTGKAAIDRCGIERTRYYMIESGVRPSPPWHVAYRIIVGAELPLEYFYPKQMIVDAYKRIANAADDRTGPETAP